MIDSSIIEELESNFDFGIEFMPSQSLTSVSTIDDEISDFLVASKSKRTTYQDLAASRRLRFFMKENNAHETRDYLDLSPCELDQLMCQFFMQAKKIEKKTVKKMAKIICTNRTH